MFRDFIISYLLGVHPPRSVEGLYERRRVPDEESVERGARHHADDGQPDVGHTLRRIAPVANAQHVRQSLEERPRVLLRPRSALNTHKKNTHEYRRVSKE